MIYPFPLPHNEAADGHFTMHESGLTSDEIDFIRDVGDRYIEQLGGRLGLYGAHTTRHVDAACIRFPLDDETRWIWDKLAERVQTINRGVYKYDLWGFEENFNYIRYTAPGEHFEWHVDNGAPTPAPRKLSCVLQLSDPSEYEGGDFQVFAGLGELYAEKGKGLITAFHAAKSHRVTPVTAGVRRTLTMFAVGPDFR